MDPESKSLLKRALSTLEENNKILRKMQRAARWAILWGFIKVAIVVAPLIIGYIYLEPFINQALENYNDVVDILSR